MGSPREKGHGTKQHHLRHTLGALPDTGMELILYDYGTLFEHNKMLNDCFGNKPLTFKMSRNNVNFEVGPLYTLKQVIAPEKDGFLAKSRNCGPLRFKY